MSKLYIERDVVAQTLADLHELITQNEVSMISLDVYSHAMANARKSRGKLRAALSAAAEPVKVNDKVWAIDHSAGRPILVLNGCSVIEAEDAEHVLSLIRAASPRPARVELLDGSNPNPPECDPRA